MTPAVVLIDNEASVGMTAGKQGNGSRTYVLVHGARFGGWVWKAVAESLRALGHTVYAPSLTGLGDRRHLLRPGINLDTHADDIVNLVVAEDLDRIVLVGWSYGGMVVSDVLGRIPERIASMVYLDAFVPERGRSMVSYANKSGSVESLLQLAVEGKDLPPLPMSAIGVDDPALVEYCKARLGPHPPMTKLQASKAPAVRPDIPHTYVLAGRHLRHSTTFQSFHDLLMAEGRADVRTIDAGHAMMLTNPTAVVDILTGVR